MNAVDMQLLSGTTQDGQWGGTIPSPVIDDPAGTTATIYYVIGTTDDDDAVSGCHVPRDLQPGDRRLLVRHQAGELELMRRAGAHRARAGRRLLARRSCPGSTTAWPRPRVDELHPALRAAVVDASISSARASPIPRAPPPA